MASVEIQLLGRFEVVVDGVRCRLPLGAIVVPLA
jgi:hypothetical protein